jgi:hypothetical protein
MCVKGNKNMAKPVDMPSGGINIFFSEVGLDDAFKRTAMTATPPIKVSRLCLC